MINITYKNNICFLSEKEWKHNIKCYLNKIKSTKVGNLLIEKLNYFIKEKGQTIEIINYSQTKSFQYPHYYSNKNYHMIVIPDTPYFIEVEVLNKELVENIDFIIFKKLIDCKEIDEKINSDLIKSFSKFKFQPICVILFHELVHCLRYLYGCNSNLEEESTIYGITNNILKIKQVEITENKFRQELNLEPRLSHDSRDICIYHNGLTTSKYCKEEIKKMFLSYKI
tara:strand:- start:1389 stop:2066 length:678 start_codon:yes stop_codon:yes gene_type:complete